MTTAPKIIEKQLKEAVSSRLRDYRKTQEYIKKNLYPTTTGS